jgi:hypothetical protein
LGLGESFAIKAGEVMVGDIEGALEAGFVAKEDGHADGRDGVAGLGREADSLVDEEVDEGADAAEAPLGEEHLVDVGELGPDGLISIDEALEVFEEFFRRFARNQGGLGEESVLDGVLGGTPFAFRGLRPFRASAIGAGSEDAT